jgi:hypothetical protein
MDSFTAAFLQQLRSSDSQKSLFREAVLAHIVSVLGTGFDEHDRAAEVNIFAEIYLNSYCFAAVEMCFSDSKVLEILKITHLMLDYELFLPAEKTMGSNEKPRDVVQQSKQKFDTMQRELMRHRERFEAEEIRRIAEYFVHSFIGNIRLYSHSLSGKQRTETTVVSIFVDEPLATLPLFKAVERIKPPKELSEGAARLQRVSRKVTLLKQLSSPRSLISPRPSEESKEPADVIDRRIDILAKKLEGEIVQRDQQIEKAIEDLKGRKK